MKPQTLKVLTILRNGGTSGVHSFTLRAAFVGNPSQRITELDDLGYKISRVRERPGPERAIGTRYTLLTEPADAPPHPEMARQPARRRIVRSDVSEAGRMLRAARTIDVPAAQTTIFDELDAA